MKTLNIFAVLLIVTFVNSSKSVSYSDMAHSLIQLEDEPNRLALLNNVQESFSASHNNLEAVNAANSHTCEELSVRYYNTEENFNMRIENYQGMVSDLTQRVQASNDLITKNNAARAQELQKMKDNGQELGKAAENLVHTEAEVEETVNVLMRLRSIAEDELSGKLKINTQMGKYKVVNQHGVSFIQTFNFSQELKNLMGKSQTSAKALISTLIMMTTEGDAHYSDPKIVRKILDVLDKIILANNNKKHTLQKNFDENSHELKELIENSHNMVLNLEQETQRAHFNIEFANRQTEAFNRDIQHLKESLARRNASFKNNDEYCNRLMKMMKEYQARYSSVAKRMQELREEFSNMEH